MSKKQLNRILSKKLPGVIKVVRRVVESHVKEEARALRKKKYPPPLPNQRYERTYRLKNSFRKTKSDRDTFHIVNKARSPDTGKVYPPDVVGMYQEPIHQGRWWKAFNVFANSVPRLKDRLDRDIEDYLNG